MKDVQGELDDLATTLGHSVSLDGPDGTLIGYSTQGADADPVRVEAILTRRVPDAVLAYQRRHGIDAATAPVRLPANPDLGMTARTCLPIRRDRHAIAYLWVLDATLDEAALRSLTEAGDRIERLLPSTDVGTLLTRLLADHPEPDLLDRLARRVRARTLQFAVVAPAPPRLTAARAVVGSTPDRGRLLVLLRTPWDDLADAPAVVGHSAPFRLEDADIAYAAQLAAQASVTADCAVIDPALGRTTSWDDLGIYRRLLLTTRPGSWPEPLPIPDEDRSAAMLRETLEVYLDHAGDAGQAIAALGIHRTTFYYRLDRLTSKYGVRLDNGLARTDLHLALKTHRLAQARDRFGWTNALLARLT
jgi:PucR-like helix-turn-helix protein